MSDNSTAILVASVLLLTVPTLAVAMRLWVRTAVLHGVGWDDALILLSWAMCMAFFAACLAGELPGTEANTARRRPSSLTAQHAPSASASTWTSSRRSTSACCRE